MATVEEAVTRAAKVPGFVTSKEMAVLAQLAQAVPHGGLIVEIGAMRGRTTVALAAVTEALVISLDNFEWVTAKQWLENTQEYFNVLLWHCDSLEALGWWVLPINMLWINGGHSYEVVHSDLFGFGPYVRDVIALHDYSDAVQQVAEEWMAEHPEWYIVKRIGATAVLRKHGAGSRHEAD